MGSVITSKKGLLKLVKGQINVEVDGSNQPAKDGEQLPKGAVLHIGENATYEITFDDGTKLSNEAVPNETATVATNTTDGAALAEIQALQDLIASGEDPTQNLPETAAGNTPGRDGNSGYVTLARSGSEVLATSGYSTAGQSVTATSTNTPAQTLAIDSPSVVVNDSNTTDEDNIATGNVLDNDSDVDSSLSVVSFEVGGTTYAAGTEVTLEGGTLVLNADGSYTFTPNENWNGQVPVITYTTNTGSSATLTINISPIDDPSVLANDSNTVDEDTASTGNVLDNDSDVDSSLSVVSFEVGGTTYAAGTEVTLEGGTLILNADGSYTFTPNENWNGQVPVITYTTNTGASATLTINVTPVADGGPSVTINTDTNNDGFISNEELAGNTEVNVTIGLDGTGANVGDTLTVNGVDYTLTQEDINNGFVNLNLPAPGEGETITVVATITDSAGNISPEGSDSALLDTTAPTITVDAPDDTQDTTPTITGSTDAPPGSTITIVVTDSTGAEQTLTTTVNPDGTYSVDVSNPLAEGGYTAVATVTDPAGNTGEATDNGNVDNTAPTVTVEAPDNTTDDTPTITGTTDATPGSVVTILITDANGATQTLTTTVNQDGTYAVDVMSPLPEGGYTAEASVTDPAGNTGTDSDYGDVIYPEVSISANQTFVNEGDTASFTVSLDQPATENVTVTFTYTGTAVDGSDFTGVISILIPAGQTSVNFNINTINDDVYEGAEDFTITISNVNGGNAAVGNNISATTTIVDDGTGPGPNPDDDRPTLSVTDAGEVSEGSNAVFTVGLTHATEAPLTINLGLNLGTAEASDLGTLTVTYVDGNGDTQTLTVAANGDVTVPAGVTSLTVTVATTQDSVYEGDETFSLQVTETGGVTTNGNPGVTGDATIVDDGSVTPPGGTPDDDRPTLSVTDAGEVSEGSNAVFTVGLTHATEAPLTINLGL
ncbi:retention module-containing protein, partial [Shewanella baltica]|uniref:retention module-containing protein n=1 Tax=Shewanella baltica TaxID=62322 RepID=UPI003D790D75